jgi:AraC family transcriptional regulator, arabinose operon regulatory protein
MARFIPSAAAVDREATLHLSGAPAQDPRIVKALDAIAFSPALPASVLAASLDLSPSWFAHLFKRHTGTSLRRHRAEQRLKTAASLLEETELSVKEVSHRVGYAHPTSFVRAFTRQFGQAPREYRRRAAAGNAN